MRAQNEPEGFGLLPRVAVAETAIFALLMDFTHIVPVFSQRGAGYVVAGRVGGHRVRDIEGVLEIAGWVLLRDVEGVEVPKAGFDEASVVFSRC